MIPATSTPMNIVVVGLGYVGVTAAACLSAQGHTVVGVDINPDKVRSINAGTSPISEPVVAELIETAVATGRLTASEKLPELSHVELVIVAVGTPSAADGSHNMGFIAESTRQISRAIAARREVRPITVAFRSTFKPGTMDELIAPLLSDALGANYEEVVELVYNPEFLRESTAVADYFAPPKIVLGTRHGAPSATMRRLHEGISAPTFEIDIREAEITKFIDNTWHAVKVAFANEVGRVCSAYRVDSSVAHKVFISDEKLNISPYYLRPGGAFGGSCLPKDVRAMQYIAHGANLEVNLIDSIIESNEAHKRFQLNRVVSNAAAGATILVVGLAFKSDTDDMRESPSVDLVSSLISLGYAVRVFDPSIHTSDLVGQNLGHISAKIPNLRGILVSLEQASTSEFDLIVATNRTINFLPSISAPILDLQEI